MRWRNRIKRAQKETPCRDAWVAHQADSTLNQTTKAKREKGANLARKSHELLSVIQSPIFWHLENDSLFMEKGEKKWNWNQEKDPETPSNALSFGIVKKMRQQIFYAFLQAQERASKQWRRKRGVEWWANERAYGRVAQHWRPYHRRFHSIVEWYFRNQMENMLMSEQCPTYVPFFFDSCFFFISSLKAWLFGSMVGFEHLWHTIFEIPRLPNLFKWQIQISWGYALENYSVRG